MAKSCSQDLSKTRKIRDYWNEGLTRVVVAVVDRGLIAIRLIVLTPPEDLYVTDTFAMLLALLTLRSTIYIAIVNSGLTLLTVRRYL